MTTRHQITALGVILGILACSTAFADFNVSVTTDKVVYDAGETVNWTTYAWADIAGSGSGVCFIGIGLEDSLGDVPQPADTELLYGLLPQLVNSEYGGLHYFILEKAGKSWEDGRLTDILVRQSHDNRMFDIGNDGASHVFAQGSYQVNELGTHELTPISIYPLYWSSPTGSAEAFSNINVAGAQFDVVPEPATMMLVGTGILGLIGIARRRRVA